jgi:hypothetical protein
VLLASAGLLVRSFLAVGAVDPGFLPEHVLTWQMMLPAGTFGARRHELDELALTRVQAIPGVQAVGATDGLFEAQPTDRGLRIIEGCAAEPRARWAPLEWDSIRGDYFQAIGTRLLRGTEVRRAGRQGNPRWWRSSTNLWHDGFGLGRFDRTTN